MEPETQDVPEVLETPEEVREETPEATEPQETPDERDQRIAQLEKEKQDLERKNKQLFERAKKQVPAPQQDGLSNKDVLFLAKADIHEDDVDEVLEWAKFKKVSVADAYKQLKTTLDVKNAERKTANATLTRPGPRGTSKVSGEELLEKAQRTGEVPDTAEGMAELFKARRARLFPNKN